MHTKDVIARHRTDDNKRRFLLTMNLTPLLSSHCCDEIVHVEKLNWYKKRKYLCYVSAEHIFTGIDCYLSSKHLAEREQERDLFVASGFISHMVEVCHINKGESAVSQFYRTKKKIHKRTKSHDNTCLDLFYSQWYFEVKSMFCFFLIETNFKKDEKHWPKITHLSVERPLKVHGIHWCCSC